MTGPIAIMVMSGPYDGSMVQLSAPKNRTPDGYILGRREECDMSFRYDRWVSGRHARLFEVNGAWFIEDLGSTNKTFIGKTRTDGTFAGREQIEGIRQVHFGQLIQLGRIWIRLHEA